MPQVKLYIASSLDGYIADPDGDVDWLMNWSPPDEAEDYGYDAFYASIGHLLMGRKTYEQVIAFGEWPYGGASTYVFSRSRSLPDDPNVEFVSEDPASFVDRLRATAKQDIWLVGGAGLIASFREQELIDEYILTVMPILLGDGIPLFEGKQPQTRLQLADARSYDNGVVQLYYKFV